MTMMNWLVSVAFLFLWTQADTTPEPTDEPTTAEQTTSQCPSADMIGVNWYDMVWTTFIVFFSCAQMSYLQSRCIYIFRCPAQ